MTWTEFSIFPLLTVVGTVVKVVFVVLFLKKYTYPPYVSHVIMATVITFFAIAGSFMYVKVREVLLFFIRDTMKYM